MWRKLKPPAFGPGVSHSFPLLPLSLWRADGRRLPGNRVATMPVVVPNAFAARIPRSGDFKGKENCVWEGR